MEFCPKCTVILSDCICAKLEELHREREKTDINKPLVETPVSTNLAGEIAKVNIQYQEGAITANELCCKIHSILTEQFDAIISEHEDEHAYFEKRYAELSTKHGM